ncbi:MAG: arginine--tRNA ligase [Chloroflexi bacterium]|nr:arginine--tRNA ligase [Chloroflexota bacterium]
MSFTPLPQRIEAILRRAIAQAQSSGALPPVPDDQELEIPIKPAKQSHYASAVAMASARLFKAKPLDIATTIGEHLPENELIGKVEVAPPGFINIWLAEAWIQQQVEVIIAAGADVFSLDIGGEQRVIVEFVSANPTGPLHVGRSRGAVVGDAAARLLEACGWQVHREYYFNNGGRQMEMLGRSIQARYLQALGEPADLPDDGYKGEYHVELGNTLAQEVGDAWRDKDWTAFKQYAEEIVFKNISATLARIGISFDQFFNELDLYDSGAVKETLKALGKAGYTYDAVTWKGASEEEIIKAKRQGTEAATWFRSSQLGDSQDRVIVRSNGDPTYVLPDIAYHVNKLERGFARAINVLGSDHFTESQVVKYGLAALGYDAERVDVILHQLVHLMRGGTRIGMSTRKGEIITLDEVMDETGPDAIRYFLLSRSTDNDISFDLDLAVKQSNENPVFYIQNAHVRCAGILRQLDERGYDPDWDRNADISLLGEEERSFVLKMLEMPEQLQMAYENLAPHQIAFWTLDLARAFHPMYERVRVLHSDVPDDVGKARLRLYRAAQIVFRRALTLMGMTAPDEM